VNLGKLPIAKRTATRHGSLEPNSINSSKNARRLAVGLIYSDSAMAYFQLKC
jgi:hypothetical protein